ncbi:MAG: hypothetical protein ABI543_04675 [Ignavibacteria bacterium]
MAVFKSTATTQLLVRKKKKKKTVADKTEAEKTRRKSIKKFLNGKIKS